MKSRYLKIMAGCLAAAFAVSAPVQAAPAVSAQSAILMDASTGRVLWERNADEQALIASTTKIMTGLLIAETCDLQARVAISKQAVGTEGSSIYLQENEILTVEALLYGMMLHSGNDAAAALAIYSAGSTEAFAEKMNQRAKELELSNTHYTNPHGLDDTGNYSTARDLAKLSVAAMENPVFAQVVSTKTAVYGNRTLTNHNKLLWRYEGAIGIKTGFTKSAGRILVSCAERGQRKLIAVTIDDPNDWKDHSVILDYGFSNYEDTQLAQAGQIMGAVPVLGGGEAQAEVVLAEDVVYPLSEGEKVSFCLNVPVFVFPPVLAGEQAGTLHILVDGDEALSIPLYWRYSVMEEA